MEIIIIAVLLFCAAFAAGSVLLTTQLMKMHDLPFIRAIMYYIIFIFVFGTYSIWGQFIIAFIASPDLPAAAVSSISLISLLFGLPFLVFGWLMLLRFSAGASGRSFPALYTALFLAINFGLIITLGVIAGETSYSNAIPYIKYYYAGISFLCAITAAITILSPGKSMPPLNINDRLKIVLISITGVIMQGIALLFIKEEIWMALIVAFLLFGFTAAIPLFLNYFAVFRVDKTIRSAVSTTIDEFLKEFEISPREAEIIREICCGLSNQEIADKLFISLQTVKDHTHRIYIKTNARNRMQLMTMVKNHEGSEHNQRSA